MRIVVFRAFVALGLFSFGTIANAAAPSNAHSSAGGTALIASAYRATLPPLHSMRYTIGFKNTSKRAWIPGKGKLLVVSGVSRESWLSSPTWASKTMPMRITQRVEPGHIGYAEFTIEAPKKSGTYVEHFSLLIDGAARTNALALVLDVGAYAAPIAARIQEVKPAVRQSVASVSAARLIQSGQSVALPTNGRTLFRVGYKNTGTAIWSASDHLTLRTSARKESYFADASWSSGSVVAPVTDAVKPGELLIVPFVINAPLVTGTFHEQFSLYQGERQIEGTSFELPLVVSRPPSMLAAAPNTALNELSRQSTALDTRSGNAVGTSPLAQSQNMIVRPGIIDDIQEQEPLIRAGLFSTKDPIRITANKNFIVEDSNGTVLFRKEAHSEVTLSFDSASMVFLATDASATSTSPFFMRLSGEARDVTGAADQDTIFELLSYQHRPSWNQALNDNLFRGTIEVRHAPATGRVWAINELKLEQYLKGIAESSNNAPFEYHKALLVAARTYAKYHINRGTKYASESFTVGTTDADQVYRGYGAELRLPNVARAVDDTRGVMVFYGNLLAITPYFSQSDGRTRSWEEVWAGGPKGWLISKDDPANRGLPLLGHGVGMSARGAVAMALGGTTFEEILAYYYTGIELHRRY